MMCVDLYTKLEELVLDQLKHTHMLSGSLKEIHQSVPYDGNSRLFNEG